MRVYTNDVPKSHKEALIPRTKYVWCTRNEWLVGLLHRHWNHSRSTLAWMESVRFLTGIISGAFQNSADILFYLKASHRDDDEENINLHEPCSWWSKSFPHKFFQFCRDLAWRPLLSFPLLFLVGLGAPISCRNKDYGANLRILGCIVFKIQMTAKVWLQQK